MTMAEYRLESIRVENFRSISGSWTIPLDSQVVLVHGPNGSGKTSLMSAIELAATGRVGFLDQHSGESQSVLRNRDYPLGSVELRLLSADQTARTGVVHIDTLGVHGEGVLDPDEKMLFLERCFLPQTALGRLLESYTTTGEEVETALVRFVKSVVGIDELDNLIDGLRPAGHLKRTVGLSAEWRATQAELDRVIKGRDTLAGQEEVVAEAASQAGQTLRALMGDHLKNVPDRDLPLHVGEERARSHSDELNQYDASRVRLEAVSAAYSQGVGAVGAHGETPLEAEAANRAAMAYELWERGHGRQVLVRLNELRRVAFGLTPIPPSQIFEAFADAQNRAQQEVRRRASIRQIRIQAEGDRARLDSEARAIRQAIERADGYAAGINVPNDVRVLIDVLEKTIPLVEIEQCPICDQPFDQQETTLRRHLEVKAESLSRGARELMVAQETLSSLRAEARRIDAEAETIILPTEEDSEPESLVRELNALDGPINAGLGLLNELVRTEARKAEATSQKANREVAERHLAAIREELQIDYSGLQISEEIERLNDIVEHRFQSALYVQQRSERVAAASRRLESLLEEAGAIRSRLEAQERLISALRTRIRVATARKEAANRVRLEAERVRSSVINHVFDQKLNALWADLFSRFIPSEPYVPRFRKQLHASRTVDIHLETVLPDGETSGAPSVMLSYGNTNTAALALFMALHLAAPSGLPWLILDDPVQSMDDIHIANFASVVRQLAYSHDRQVIIAVHQQELFEYLSLELAPAKPGQSLRRVRLDRRRNATHIQTERIEQRGELSLFSP